MTEAMMVVSRLIASQYSIKRLLETTPMSQESMQEVVHNTGEALGHILSLLAEEQGIDEEACMSHVEDCIVQLCEWIDAGGETLQ